MPSQIGTLIWPVLQIRHALTRWKVESLSCPICTASGNFYAQQLGICFKLFLIFRLYWAFFLNRIKIQKYLIWPIIYAFSFVFKASLFGNPVFFRDFSKCNSSLRRHSLGLKDKVYLTIYNYQTWMIDQGYSKTASYLLNILWN